jgi:hypothetical protein
MMGKGGKETPLEFPPFSIPGVSLPFSVEVGCKSAKLRIELGEKVGEGGTVEEKAGAVLELTHHYGTDHSTTVFIGVQAKVDATGVQLNATAAYGATFTVSKDWQISDLGLRADFDVATKNPIDVGAKVATRAVIERGAPDLKFDVDPQLPTGAGRALDNLKPTVKHPYR